MEGMMLETRDVIQHIKEEDSDSYSDDSLFNISSWGADLSFRELLQRYDDDELLRPELQRHYVWDKTEASRFIESLLLGLPVPSIFLAKTGEDRLLIVDGYQRIMTVRDYVRGIFSGDSKVFRLSRSERINRRWRGKAFTELQEAEQRRIRNTTIHAIIFLEKLQKDEDAEGDDTSLFQVFERINTSGRTLLPQEIRNCVAQGYLNTLLFQLNGIREWRGLFGLREADSRMRDMEFILRFFALSSDMFADDRKERLSLKRFLDLYMKNNANPDSVKLSELGDRFTRSVRLVWESFGACAFHNISPTDPERLVPKFSPTLCDSILIAADNALMRDRYTIPENPEEARRSLLQDESYRFAVTHETMSRTCIIKRIKMASEFLFGVHAHE
jgi:hypothetical protein